MLLRAEIASTCGQAGSAPMLALDRRAVGQAGTWCPDRASVLPSAVNIMFLWDPNPKSNP